jgi:hypothetical protein
MRTARPKQLDADLHGAGVPHNGSPEENEKIRRLLG